jgi:hypothetical protein
MTTAVLAVLDALAAGMVTPYPDPQERPITGLLGPTDPPQRATLLAGSSRVEPPSVACPVRVYTVRVWAITPITAPGAGDDALDELLDASLAALDAAGIGWSEAVRGVWADGYPSYEITTEVRI